MNRPVDAPTRRSLMTAAAEASALVAAAQFLPPITRRPAEPVSVPAVKRGGGYHVTDHVKRYYQTARS